MSNSNIPTFTDFLGRFPLIELPTTLGEESHHIFSSENDPIPIQIIDTFILPIENEESNPLTEYIACFQLPMPQGFHAIVYWKAELLNYQYKLVTFDTKGNKVDERVIAGTTYLDDELTQSVAIIKEDLQIYVVSGQSQIELEEYKASSSTANRFQLSTNGKIVEL